MTSLEEIVIPGYVVGTWSIDPAHSYVGLVVRHSMVSTVRGQFDRFRGEIVTAQDVVDSAVNVTIDVASFHSDDEARDAGVRSARSMDAERFPAMTFVSTGISLVGDFVISGDLTVMGATRAVDLQATTPQFGQAPGEGTAVGISGHTFIRRSEFGVDIPPRGADRNLHGQRRRRSDSRGRGRSQALTRYNSPPNDPGDRPRTAATPDRSASDEVSNHTTNDRSSP